MLSLQEIYIESEVWEEVALKRMTNLEDILITADIMQLWHRQKTEFLYKSFLAKVDESYRNNLYQCGRIDEFLIKRYNSRLLDAGIVNICYVLLSDNLGLINRYADLTHPWYTHTVKSGSLVHAIQSIIKEDWSSLEKDIITYERITSTQKGKINIPDLMYFKGMLNRDENVIREALYLLLKDHKKRNKYMGIAQDYISIPALGYAKLAWLKGLKVDIDHPFIPREFLPYKPLDKYEDKYDFLREF